MVVQRQNPAYRPARILFFHVFRHTSDIRPSNLSKEGIGRIAERPADDETSGSARRAFRGRRHHASRRIIERSAARPGGQGHRRRRPGVGGTAAVHERARVQPCAQVPGHRPRRRGREPGDRGQDHDPALDVSQGERVLHMGVPHRREPPQGLPHASVRERPVQLRDVRGRHRRRAREGRPRPVRRGRPRHAGA